MAAGDADADASAAGHEADRAAVGERVAVRGGRRRAARGRPRAARGAGAEAVGGAAVLALVQVALHVPAPAEGLPARRAAVGPAVDMPVVLQRARMLNNASRENN